MSEGIKGLQTYRTDMTFLLLDAPSWHFKLEAFDYPFKQLKNYVVRDNNMYHLTGFIEIFRVRDIWGRLVSAPDVPLQGVSVLEGVYVGREQYPY